MVGFGSSLRIARRPGWEGAYLDYEALKLLLSQIEAIYEAEGTAHPQHPQNHHSHPYTTTSQSDGLVMTTTTEVSGTFWEGEDEDAYDTTNSNNNKNIMVQRRGTQVSSLYRLDRTKDSKRNQQQRRLGRGGRRRRIQSDQYDDNNNNNTWNHPHQDDDVSYQQPVIRDYRVDIFLESDSDKAYASVDDPYDDEEATTTDEDDTDVNLQFHRDMVDGTTMEEARILQTVTAFTSYSQATLPLVDSKTLDDEYVSDDDLIIGQKGSNSSCWGGTSSNTHTTQTQPSTGTNTDTEGKKNAGSARKKTSMARQNPRSHRKGGSGEQLLFSRGSTTRHDDPHHRYHDIASSSRYNTSQQPLPITPPWKAAYPYYGDTVSDTTSYYYHPNTLQYLPSTTADESTTLLLQPPLLFRTPSGNKNGSSSPPGTNYYPYGNRQASTTTARTSYGMQQTSEQNQSSTAVVPDLATKKKVQPTAQEIRRTQERRRKRRMKVQRLRIRRERKVPRYIRIAHMRARAITERFLGLLRAETEKVLLFAQSRLGELADTAGSLRFPSYDEEYASNHPTLISSKHNPNPNAVTPGGGEYNFGDGGIHPSASSSSDDQYNGGGGYHRRRQQQQWFSDSSDEEDEQSHQQTSDSLSNRIVNDASSNIMYKKKTATAATTRTNGTDHLRYVQRQIAHFTELRKRRAIFQRSEHILGDDMLFLSAVEEVDGYTAVGVELLHTLKYICINLIAVRKICRKHDRLLMNRMLGGYYHRLRYHKSNIAGVQTLGGMVTEISGDVYEAHPAAVGQRNHYKLVGVYDDMIQKVANSRTVQVVSSCLALSLSEYEVARSRADALTRLDSSFDSVTLRHENDHAVTDETDVESLHDAPSTASNISLTRLRYTVMSIFALREVSRVKRDYLMTYLSRESLVFTGQPVIGEGLDGCSRETLDFLVAYDPDTALVREPMLLFEGLKQNRWSYLPLGDVMISSLATATIEGDLTYDVAMIILQSEERNVLHAVSANPECNIDFWKAMLSGQAMETSAASSRTGLVRNVPPMMHQLSRISLILYSVCSAFICCWF
jgi:hypothetical protein